MTDKPAHPCETDLAAYGLGQLPPEAAAAVEEHIHTCEPCCETIAGLSDEDTFVELLQDARQVPAEDTKIYGQADSVAPEVPIPLMDHPRYEVFGLIGKGGMGDVYRARHRMMKRTVALKVIKREFVRRPEAVDRFQREVTAAAQLSHPNIVTAFDAEQAGNVHYLVMEHVDGINLSQTVNDRGALSIAEACDYVRQAAVGLQHAHERGMVHRDIKPHNLMVTGDGTVKILDFGLASLAPQPTTEEPLGEDADGNLTIAGAIMGTPDFISPEQAQDAHNVDGRSDIYSLGMTLYFLLSGKVPFNEGSATDKLKMHAESDPVKLSDIRPDVPDGVQKVFDRMTAKDPSQRFQSPQAVADALKEYFGEPPETKADKRIGDRGLPWWLIAVAVLIGACGLVAYQNPHFFSWRVTAESEVRAPISELKSYVASMAASPHDLVFMNASNLGPDKVGLGFKTLEDGLLMNINVSSSGGNRSGGKYASRMKEIAAAASVPVTEEARIGKDGSVSGVNFIFRLTGQPSDIAETVQQIVAQGLALHSTDIGVFQCHNFPSHLIQSDDYSARLVTGEEFVAEYERGERVYLGENEQYVFLVPEARQNESTLDMNDEIWHTDVRDLQLASPARFDCRPPVAGTVIRQVSNTAS